MTVTTASSYTFEEVEKRVSRALEDFKVHDLQLLELTADERAATHQIACHLHNFFPDWHVDCEYNRRKDDSKELQGIGEIRPDIIIHRRYEQENLLVIEVKKKGKSVKKDRVKLIEFTKVSGVDKYQFGLLLWLPARRPFIVREEWYQNGDHNPEYDKNLHLEEEIL